MIKNIVFDLGNVLLDIDYKLTQNAFNRLGFDDFENKFSQTKADFLFDEFERGKISKENFLKELKTYSKKSVAENDLINAWNAMLLDYRIESLELVESIKTKYRVFLLSNTNEIHVDAFTQHLKSTTRFSTLHSLFEKVYYSNEIFMRKPDVEIYEFVTQDSNLTPDETLFFDDTEKNIITAKNFGWKTHWLKSGEKVEEILKETQLVK